MDATAQRKLLKARWILPVAGNEIEHGAVELDGERIKNVYTAAELAESGLESQGLDVVDYGESIITPGFINLHTHIEYTAMHHFDTELGLFEWIRAMMGTIRSWSAQEYLNSAVMGAKQCARFGTTCIVDSSYTGNAAIAASRAGLRAVVGLELFGLHDDEELPAWEKWTQKLDALLEHSSDSGLADGLSSKRIKLTVAPHAPYTVSPRLMRRAIAWADNQSLPALIHLSESQSEVDWLKGSSERIDRFLAGVPNARPPEWLAKLGWRRPDFSPVELAAHEGILQNNVVAAHCVHVSRKDADELARRQVGVAHCPRSNARLRNGVQPLEMLVESGVQVGFGTDSAASNDDLSLLNEARFGWNLHRALCPEFKLSPREALNMLTIGAAKIIDADDIIGTLEPGKLADIAVFNIDEAAHAARSKPYDLLLFGPARMCDLYVGGVKVVNNGV